MILKGGLTPGRTHLLEGAPGSGKTTLGLQYLLEGVRAGEKCLYVTLSETREELAAVVASHGWTLDGIDLFELSSAEEVLGDGRHQTVLHPWEVELSASVDLIMKRVEEAQPKRLVFDSLSKLRLLGHPASSRAGRAASIPNHARASTRSLCCRREIRRQAQSLGHSMGLSISVSQ